MKISDFLNKECLTLEGMSRKCSKEILSILAIKNQDNEKMVDAMVLPTSNFLLSISIPIILEAPAALAPSATCKSHITYRL